MGRPVRQRRFVMAGILPVLQYVVDAPAETQSEDEARSREGRRNGKQRAPKVCTTDRDAMMAANDENGG